MEIEEERRILKRGGRRRNGLVYHKRRHQEAATVCHSALNKYCLLHPLPLHCRPLQLHPPLRRLAPASLDMLTTRACTIASSSLGQQSRIQEVRERGGERKCVI